MIQTREEHLKAIVPSRLRCLDGNEVNNIVLNQALFQILQDIRLLLDDAEEQLGEDIIFKMSLVVKASEEFENAFQAIVQIAGFKKKYYSTECISPNATTLTIDNLRILYGRLQSDELKFYVNGGEVSDKNSVKNHDLYCRIMDDLLSPANLLMFNMYAYGGIHLTAHDEFLKHMR